MSAYANSIQSRIALHKSKNQPAELIHLALAFFCNPHCLFSIGRELGHYGTVQA